MWRGTKEDPGGLGRLSAAPFIHCSSLLSSVPPCMHDPKTIPGPPSVAPDVVRDALSVPAAHAAHLPKTALYTPSVQLKMLICTLMSTLRPRRFMSPCPLTFRYTGVNPELILWKSSNGEDGPGSSQSDRKRGVTQRHSCRCPLIPRAKFQLHQVRPVTYKRSVILLDKSRASEKGEKFRLTVSTLSFFPCLPLHSCMCAWMCSFWAIFFSRPLSLLCLPW